MGYSGVAMNRGQSERQNISDRKEHEEINDREKEEKIIKKTEI